GAGRDGAGAVHRPAPGARHGGGGPGGEPAGGGKHVHRGAPRGLTGQGADPAPVDGRQVTGAGTLRGAMRVAILADVHGNLPACEAVLQDIARNGADVVVAAGDLALRGAHPRETVELLFDRCQAVLMGNTDCYIAGNYLGGAYREREHWKRDLLAWTRDQLGPELTRKLGELPFRGPSSPPR